MLRGRLLRCGIWATALIMACSAAARAADLVIAMPNWSSGQATANILKVGLKKEFGLDAEVVEMGTLIAFAGLDSGKVDIHPEVWLPNLDNLVDRYVTKAKTVALSPKGVPAWQGICANRAAANDGIRVGRGSRKSEEDGRPRHRWRRQGRDVDRRGNLVVDDHRAHPRATATATPRP